MNPWRCMLPFFPHYCLLESFISLPSVVNLLAFEEIRAEKIPILSEFLAHPYPKASSIFIYFSGYANCPFIGSVGDCRIPLRLPSNCRYWIWDWCYRGHITWNGVVCEKKIKFFHCSKLIHWTSLKVNFWCRSSEKGSQWGGPPFYVFNDLKCRRCIILKMNVDVLTIVMLEWTVVWS